MKKFDAVRVTDKIVEFIRNYYKENNLGGVVLGISGGKDSAVVAALFVKALGNKNVVGLTLPCHSREDDKKLAEKISQHYGFTLYNIDLTGVFDTFKEQINNIGSFSLEELKNSDINIKPRLRMSSCYYMAALLSFVNNKTYLVAGTSNKCELYVGYFTKGGDSVHDIAPISDLTVEEVIKVGEVLGVPSEVLYRTPDDGLSSMSDEEKLGVKYSAVASYMEDESSVSDEDRRKIEKLHKNNRHKFDIPKYVKE